MEKIGQNPEQYPPQEFGARRMALQRFSENASRFVCFFKRNANRRRFGIGRSGIERGRTLTLNYFGDLEISRAALGGVGQGGFVP